MSKLYPPEIGGTLPAFYLVSKTIQLTATSEQTLNVLEIKIPFIMNKTVASTGVTGFKLIIRSVANSKLLGYLTVTSINETMSGLYNLDEGWVKFYIPASELVLPNANNNYKGGIWSDKLFVGQHYKFQLAYIDTNEIIGHYSSVGVAKYTTKPNVSISDLEQVQNNNSQQIFVGCYDQIGENKDVTEKVYSYRFDIQDTYGNLFVSSGDQLHNSFEDENGYSSRDTFKLNKDLIENERYKIKYTVNTTNNATFSSPWYYIVQKTTVDPEIKATLSASMNFNNGYIDVRLVGQYDENNVEYPATGRFVLKRGCSKDNYGEWNTILNFQLNGSRPSRWLYRDFTVEHGYEYKYALQQYNDRDLYSNKIYTEPVYVAFEDILLYDGEKQLKMKFNPKITSFKNTLLETKTNTIGNKYPYTFRNGSVCYKEFPINGLISYFSDEEELFISNEEILLNEKTTNLLDTNLASERLFKLKVLEFFNDGKPKLFRSPTEGNYIVKLINVSMTPTDQVGRMLHSITGTAYEVADCNYENMLDMGFIHVADLSDEMITRWATIPLYNKNGNLLERGPIYDLKLENIAPGTKFTINFEDNTSSSILIGATGTYEAHSDVGIVSLTTESVLMNESVLVYQYKENETNTFDKIIGVDLLTYPAVQWFGAKENILDDFNNIELELLEVFYLHFTKREVYTIYAQDDKKVTAPLRTRWNNELLQLKEQYENKIISELQYKNAVFKLNNEYYSNMIEKYTEFSWDPVGRNIIGDDEYNIYHVYRVMVDDLNDINNMIKHDNFMGYYSGKPVSGNIIQNYSNVIEIKYKGEEKPVLIDLTETGYYELNALENLESIRLPIGVYADGGICVKKLSYNIGETESANPVEIYKESFERYEHILYYGEVLNEDQNSEEYQWYINNEYTDEYKEALNTAKQELNEKYIQYLQFLNETTGGALEDE